MAVPLNPPYEVDKDDLAANLGLVTPRAKLPLQQSIETAYVIVENYLVSKGLSEELLSKIAYFLSAHFYEVHTKPMKFAVQGNSQKTTSFDSGEFLMMTTYGVSAVMLDHTNTLKNMGKNYCEIKVI